MNRIFEIIEERRKAENMSVRQLCTLTDIPDATYRNWVHGRSDRADFEVIHRLTLALKITLNDLVAPAEEAPAPSVVAELREINQTPASTQEVDTAVTVLLRTIEANSAAHQAELNMLRAEFAETMARREAQLHEIITARDAQFERERAIYADRIAEKRRIANVLSAACGVLGLITLLLIAGFIACRFA